MVFVNQLITRGPHIVVFILCNLYILIIGGFVSIKPWDLTIEDIGIYIYPICSMYGIFTYIWVIFRVNVVKYSIHGAYGYDELLI
jgi:hypothetical protein